MNYRLATLLLFLLAVASCTKPANKQSASSSGILLGKWLYAEQYYSTGGPGQWHAVQPAGQTVEFKADGTFQTAASFSSTFQRYEIIDSTKVKFAPASTPSGYVVMEYNVNAAEGTLFLSPIEPMCIEGCSYKFKRNTE